MSELTLILVGIAIGAGVVSIVSYCFYHQRLVALRYEFIAIRTFDQRDAAESVDRKIREREDIFSVKVEPFVREIRKSGFISKVTDIEVGYQYQLFVRGVPAFEPHRVTVEHHREKEITEEGWERLKASAQALVSVAIAPELGAVEKLVSLAKTKVLRSK